MGLRVKNWIWSREPLSERGFLRLKQLAFRGEVTSYNIREFFVYLFESLVNPIEEVGAYIEDEVYGAFLHGKVLELKKNPKDSGVWIPVDSKEIGILGERDIEEYCLSLIEEDMRDGQPL